MKAIFLALTVLFATCASTYAQTRPTGTWQADGGWEVVLGADGSQVTGMVGECPRTGSEILDGRIDGNKITFKCNRDDRFGAIAFTGTINGDEIALTWQLPSGENSAAAVRSLANSPMFGGSTRSRFTVRRVPDGDLAKTAAEMALRVRGVEFSAAVNIQKDNLRVIGTLFLPQRVSSVRVVVVAFRWGSGSQFYPNPEVRKLAETIDAALLLTDFATITTPTNYSPRHDGADGLLMLLQHLAQESGHRELRDAPLVLWGHSAATSLPGTFAGVYPNRVIAMVRERRGMGLQRWPRTAWR